MNSIGDIRWIFNESKNIKNIKILKDNILSSKKNINGSSIDEFQIISKDQVIKLFPELADEMTQSNRIKFLLPQLENDEIFEQIFKIVK